MGGSRDPDSVERAKWYAAEYVGLKRRLATLQDTVANSAIPMVYGWEGVSGESWWSVSRLGGDGFWADCLFQYGLGCVAAVGIDGVVVTKQVPGMEFAKAWCDEQLRAAGVVFVEGDDL